MKAEIRGEMRVIKHYHNIELDFSELSLFYSACVKLIIY